jgi:photosystem II stability/assembly factor-like uncharacterized protein
VSAPWLAAVACAAAAARAAGPGAFADPLDVPAVESRLAPHRPLTAIAATGGGRLVAVGQRGHVLTSDDGGASWAQAAVPVSTDLTAVFFPTSRRGYAVGHDGVVLATSDGGRSWEAQLDGRRLAALVAARVAGVRDPALRERLAVLASRGEGQSFLDVWFADERTGFAVGAFDLLVHTEDGGRTWTPWLGRTDNPRGLHLHAIRHVAGALWIVGERGLALKLEPAAGRFRAQRPGYAGSFLGLAGDDHTVILHGLQGSAFRSADGGTTWRRIPTGLAVALTASTVLPDGRLVLVSQAGDLLVSSDGGASFAPAPATRPRSAAAAAPAGSGAVAIVGMGGVSIERIR